MNGKSSALFQSLISVSQGEEGADFYFKNGKVLNVFTGEILDGNVAVRKKHIAYVGTSEKMVKPGTEIIDVKGAYLVPGFIDAHCHPDLYSNPASFCDHVVRHGTTTIFVDAQDLCNSFGMEGFKELLTASYSYPVRAFFLVPAVSPPFPGVEGEELFDDLQMTEFLKMPRVTGLAEITSYTRILKGDQSLLARIASARNTGKTVEGHTSGASYEKLNVLVAGGLTSCHESVTPDDVRNRLRLGLYTMIRCGSIRCELDMLGAVLRERNISQSSRVILTPDGLFPDRIMRDGYMDYVIEKAGQAGVDVVQAIRMCTINPALYAGMDHDLGAIAPGRLADILVLKNLENPTPHTVMQDGRMVVINGEYLLEPSPRPKIRDQGKPFLIKEKFPDLFRVKAAMDRSRGIPVAVIENKTLTRRQDLILPIQDGYLEADPANDIFKATVLLRNGKMHNSGFVKGLGVDADAISSSVCHEIHEILVLGRKDTAMQMALQRLQEIKGGVVIVKGQRIVHEMRLPVGGTMSIGSFEETANDLTSIKQIFRSLGCTLEEPLWTIWFLTFSPLIELRLTVSGMYDVKQGKIVFDAKNPLF
ncbi:MAG: adenine deaminase C-terminal domain-containing protein [Desulfatirhabdiaceae bacterium]